MVRNVSTPARNGCSYRAAVHRVAREPALQAAAAQARRLEGDVTPEENTGRETRRRCRAVHIASRQRADVGRVADDLARGRILRPSRAASKGRDPRPRSRAAAASRYRHSAPGIPFPPPRERAAPVANGMVQYRHRRAAEDGDQDLVAIEAAGRRGVAHMGEDGAARRKTGGRFEVEQRGRMRAKPLASSRNCACTRYFTPSGGLTVTLGKSLSTSTSITS